MNIFGVGLPEVTVILILALLIFGPKKLPELGKQLGKTLKSLKKASNEFQNEIDQVMNEEDKDESPKSIESNQTNEINQEKQIQKTAKNNILDRPITPIDEFERALDKAALTKEEYELIDYIRYTSVFTQPSLIKDLKRPSKPPLLSVLCQICRKIGSEMPDHFKKVIEWSIEISDHNTKWDAHLICAEALNIDKIPLSPIHGTTLFDVLVVHKELFLGFD